MLLLLFLSLLLLTALFATTACWVGLIWLLRTERVDPETPPAISISQTMLRKLEARALWRSMSAWMAAKPLRLQDRSKRPAG